MLVEKHDKNCWSVSLFDDGTMYIVTSYARRQNIGHSLTADYGAYLFDLPGYVREMIYQMRDAHRDVSRLSLGTRIYATDLARFQPRVKATFNRYQWQASRGMHQFTPYFSWSSSGISSQQPVFSRGA